MTFQKICHWEKENFKILIISPNSVKMNSRMTIVVEMKIMVCDLATPFCVIKKKIPWKKKQIRKERSFPPTAFLWGRQQNHGYRRLGIEEAERQRKWGPGCSISQSWSLWIYIFQQSSPSSQTAPPARTKCSDQSPLGSLHHQATIDAVNGGAEVQSLCWGLAV
jgi:hypothetical protein